MVPRQAVGVVIGKGGDMIKRIQQDSGARVQFIQGKEDVPGDKLCQVTGTLDQVKKASAMIRDLIQSVLKPGRRNHVYGKRGAPSSRYSPRSSRTAFSKSYPQKKSSVASKYDKPPGQGGPPGGGQGGPLGGQGQYPGPHYQQYYQPYAAPGWPSDAYLPWPNQPASASVAVASNDPAKADANAAAWSAYYAQFYNQIDKPLAQPQPGAIVQAQPAAAQPASQPQAILAQSWLYFQPWQADYWVEYWKAFYRSAGMYREAELMEQLYRGEQAQVLLESFLPVLKSEFDWSSKS